MQVTRYKEAKPYEAAEHYDMRCLRLQGKEATETDTIWIGLSHLLPGGRTSLKDAAVEKIYVVIAGEVTVETPTGTDDATLPRQLSACAGRGARAGQQHQ